MVPKNCHLWQKEKLAREDLDFERVETIQESSHLDRLVMKCKRCGQLYFYEFFEREKKFLLKLSVRERRYKFLRCV